MNIAAQITGFTDTLPGMITLAGLVFLLFLYVVIRGRNSTGVVSNPAGPTPVLNGRVGFNLISSGIVLLICAGTMFYLTVSNTIFAEINVTGSRIGSIVAAIIGLLFIYFGYKIFSKN